MILLHLYKNLEASFAVFRDGGNDTWTSVSWVKRQLSVLQVIQKQWIEGGNS